MGGAKVSGALTPQANQQHNPAVHVKDLGNGAYEVSHVIEKTGPYKLDVMTGPQVGGREDVLYMYSGGLFSSFFFHSCDGDFFFFFFFFSFSFCMNIT
jgi:hypothetical protein